MKMYILIRDSVPLGLALVAVGHASLACFLRWKEDDDMLDWLDHSFRKVICRVSDAEFEKAKEFEDFEVLKESALENQEVALAFKPRDQWPKAFQFFKLYR